MQKIRICIGDNGQHKNSWILTMTAKCVVKQFFARSAEEEEVVENICIIAFVWESLTPSSLPKNENKNLVVAVWLMREKMSQQMIVATTQKENKNVLLLCKKGDISRIHLFNLLFGLLHFIQNGLEMFCHPAVKTTIGLFFSKTVFENPFRFKYLLYVNTHQTFTCLPCACEAKSFLHNCFGCKMGG